MQYRFDTQTCNVFGQRWSPHPVINMVALVTVVQLAAHDPRAVQIKNQAQVKPAPHHDSGHLGDGPALVLMHGGSMRVVGGRNAWGA